MYNNSTIATVINILLPFYKHLYIQYFKLFEDLVFTHVPVLHTDTPDMYCLPLPPPLLAHLYEMLASFIHIK